MPTIHLFWPAIVVAGVVYFVLGAIWYAPPVFGGPWSKIVQRRPAPQEILMSLFIDVLAAILLGVMLAWTGASGARDGILVGAAGWAAFIGTTTATGAMFEPKRSPVYLINAAYTLLGFVVMGAIIGYWQG